MLNIDVVIPVYNKAGYLSELLDLLLSQPDLYDNIILVDDCSTDNSVDLIRSYQDKYSDKILLHCQDHNQGPHFARMKGAEISGKDFIMFVDADDLVNLKGLRSFLQTKVKWESYGVCFGHTQKVYTNKIDFNITLDPINVQARIDNLMGFFKYSKPTMSGIVVRSDIIPLMAIDNCFWGEDLIFYVKALNQQPFFYKNDIIGIYRIIEGTRGTSGGNLSKRLIFLRQLYREINFQKGSSGTCFFIKTSIRTLLAWFIKKIGIR